MTPAPQAQAKFDPLSIQAGDIIFVLPRSSGWSWLKQQANVQGQHLLAKIRRAKRLGLAARVRKYSHVMLGVGGGLIIHADGKKVALEVVTDALDFASTSYQVFRQTGLPAATAAQVAKAGIRYMQQKYSFAAYFKKTREDDTTQFCSRLVAHAYRAAGMPLGALADKDVLPLDLYMLCQEAPWTDVTEESFHRPLSTEAEALAGEIGIPGQGAPSLSEFFDRSDKLLLDSAQMHKQFQEMRHQSYRRILHVEGLLAQYCVLMFTHAKQLRTSPADIDDSFAGKIAGVLGQIDTLLDLASLPDIDLLIENTLINTDTGASDSEYAGMPGAAAVREMQTGRETILCYTYLLLAETGLLSIVAHIVPHDKFEAFRAVDRERASGFLAALLQAGELKEYAEAENAFAWVDIEADRDFCRQSYKSILALLEIVRIATARQA
ncbi:YiiX/YebB-like N1pC/P60 family cysteine hydrolase [Massilia sp. ST3]|uniref:YiiX/YebB-like N1pC/P60 family cysteine hydrolase n=1 Tax=Massilia sp. ST3 TaxID=2824903 RepID=UPI001B81C0F6|nr:YiiX/YebB-like N1pC/P60 family cysteine hydrolase [Massilia sp. ST3]MBQ5950011.1 hypothetical protein [Massilia sp. ST3]